MAAKREAMSPAVHDSAVTTTRACALRYWTMARGSTQTELVDMAVGVTNENLSYTSAPRRRVGRCLMRRGVCTDATPYPRPCGATPCRHERMKKRALAPASETRVKHALRMTSCGSGAPALHAVATRHHGNRRIAPADLASRDRPCGFAGRP